VPKDDRLKKLGYRMLIVGKYLVFYVVKANTVQIRRIIHGARQYSFLL
jgi:plasmid stabilization system protein ParE